MTFLLHQKIARLKTCFSVSVLAKTARKAYFGQSESYQCKSGPNSVFKIMIYGWEEICLSKVIELGIDFYFYFLFFIHTTSVTIAKVPLLLSSGQKA